MDWMQDLVEDCYQQAQTNSQPSGNNTEYLENPAICGSHQEQGAGHGKYN
jgi:hypothetical protein